VTRLAKTLLGDVDTSDGVRLLGVGVSGLADWIQEELFADTEDTADDGDRADAGVDVDETAQGTEEELDRLARRRGWYPGMDVVHADHGRGWVWGAGVGRVTVRFETAETGPGPVRTFREDDPGLSPFVPERPPSGT
jgi:DNA polymerase-4